jgi:hypothetical protein
VAGRVVVGLLGRFRACRLYSKGLTLSVMASEPTGKVSDPFCGDSVKGLTLFLWGGVFSAMGGWGEASGWWRGALWRACWAAFGRVAFIPRA